jgi:hypothetical protein
MIVILFLVLAAWVASLKAADAEDFSTPGGTSFWWSSRWWPPPA